MKNEQNIRLINRVIFILSLLGVAVAVYVLQSFLRQSPIVCISTGCETVRKSPASYPFGIPVPAFGLVGYTLLALLTFLRTMKIQTRSSKLALKFMLGISTFGVLFVSWFTYTELFIIRGVCTWCAVSAINMVFIFLLTLRSYLLEKNPD
jgi:uncharacterized membrane protein